ncbi:hypothetical protein ACFWJW_34475 [Streptomyces sp. NPDC127097]
MFTKTADDSRARADRHAEQDDADALGSAGRTNANGNWSPRSCGT